MSNTLPLTQQSESPPPQTPQRAPFHSDPSQGASKGHSPAVQQSSAQRHANPLQSSSKSPQVRLSNAVISPASILKEGKKLFRNPETSGPAFGGVAGQDTRGGYHGGGSPFNNQVEALKHRFAAGA